MTIGEKIYSLRTSAGLSQEEFSEILNVSRQSISKWETDSSTPELEKLLKICDVFRISLDELTGRNAVTDSVSNELKNRALSEYGEEISENEFSETKRCTESFIGDVTDKADEADNNSEKTKKLRFNSKKMIAVITVLSILICGSIVPFFKDEIKELWWEMNGGKIQYTNVLVHGLGGWGNDAEISSFINYWGGGADDLVKYLNSQDYKTVAPSVGPVSSAWDRACELYAQLTGTTVDYGAVHSKNHNHERYGRTYNTPLIENWGEKINGGQLVKINLIGHSFGGATVRLLASLLEYGNEDETTETGKNTSPLFTGNKGEWVHSLTTLCAPHNGSSLTEILDELGEAANIDNTAELLVSLCFFMDTGNNSEAIYDLQLDQFGLSETPADKTAFNNAVEKVVFSGNDHAGYDLSPDGAAKLNKTIKTVDSIYYFSYAYSTTYQGNILDIQLPKIGTLPILSPIAAVMGAFNGTTADGIVIDKSWRENDGLVNVISAKYPFGEDFCDYDKDNINKGIWNVFPTKTGDHGNVIGLNEDIEKTHQFWTELLKSLSNLKR